MHWPTNLLQTIRKQPPWKVLFLGTDDFALGILKALHKDYIRGVGLHRCSNVVGELDVVTKSRPCAVGSFADLDCHQYMKHMTWPEVDVSSGRYDVGVIASFGQLLPESFIQLFPYGILNIHPSLLPKWRGAAPIPSTILSGEKVTGVTIQEIQPKRFDVGPIVLQETLNVPIDCSSLQLSKLLSELGSQLIMKALADLPRLEAMEIDQDDSLATYAHKIKKNDPRLTINWPESSCIEVDRTFRAFHEFRDLRSYFGERMVKFKKPLSVKDLWWDTLRDPLLASRPGSAAYIPNMDVLAIQCKDGLFGIRELTIGKRLSAKSFHNGYLSKPAWKYVQFRNEPVADLVKQKPLTQKQRKERLKHWHMQMLRIASSYGKMN